MPAYVQHLSVRVPWHDAGWNGSVCSAPRNNTFCVLLENIGLRRDDQREAEHAGQDVESMAPQLPPCLEERASFLSPRDMSLTKTHPYGWTKALQGLQPANISLPAWSVHATPYYWLAHDHVDELQQGQPIPGFAHEREDEALDLIGFDAKRQTWVIHGDNQKALIETFFQDVRPAQSLVFFYLKHSPFEEVGRVLVGAALVESVVLPSRWPTDSPTAFPNHMWETVVRHTLRSDGTGGVLLPLQELAILAASGSDVSGALAIAPQTDREFSYVTEHVPADIAVGALLALKRATEGCEALGHALPASSLEWLDQQLRLAWQRRGVAPGLPAVLAYLHVEHPTFAARVISSTVPEGEDPWLGLLAALNENANAPQEVARLLTPSRRRRWQKTPLEVQQALQLLSRFDITPAQCHAILDGDTSVVATPQELLENPYHLVTCTVDDDDPVAFEVVDRGCFPDRAPEPRHALPLASTLDDPLDPRRIEAALVHELREASGEGHTLLPVEAVLERLARRPVSRPMPLDLRELEAAGLDPASLDDDPDATWPVLVRTALADGGFAYKLRSAAFRRRLIRDVIDQLKGQDRHAAPDDLEGDLDRLLPSLDDHDAADLPAELRARQEKRAALAELYAARFTVLNGPAGTGKTTLIKALVHRREVATAGVLLLAPTGKARVQLAAKVDHDAATLAQFLAASGRYDGETGRYRATGDPASRRRVGLVVVDEASMLTEDMLAALCDALVAPQRLILVGDPRQLPPIGAGRPFVDLERAAGADVPAGTWPRVATGWAALTVLRRQKGQVRDDLMLARWFAGDDIPEGFDEVWERLRASTPMATLRAVPWEGRSPEVVLDAVLAEELDVRSDDDGRSFAESYGATVDEYVNYWEAAAKCEQWQLLSPFRGRIYGTMALNRYLKERYRRVDLDKALGDARYRRVPKPLGAERIVLGDKVVNLANRAVWYWSREDGQQKGYVANGEIGVVIGQLRTKAMKAAPKKTQIEYSSQLGRRYGASSGGVEGDAPIELAWALTVHKSQGSEFGLVVLMLPAGVRRLSRELLYTALTRQTRRIVICHEGPLDDLVELTRASGSDTGRRMTDLMVAPAPVAATSAAGEPIGVLDARLVHITAGGVLVRSKNEVIIAGILDELVPGAWAYEQPLIGSDGKRRLPDFTINAPDGTTVYWEHLGMLDDPAYAEAWEHKRGWYERQGITPAGRAGGKLLTTDDRAGVDLPAWKAAAEAAIGRGPHAAAKRQPAKKVAAKKR